MENTKQRQVIRRMENKDNLLTSLQV